MLLPVGIFPKITCCYFVTFFFFLISFVVWQMWLIGITGWILYGRKLCIGIDNTNNLHCECDFQYIFLISWEAFLHLLGDERLHKSRQSEKGYVKPFADGSLPGRWQKGMGGERSETKTFRVWRKELSLCWKEIVCQNMSGGMTKHTGVGKVTDPEIKVYRCLV